MRHLIAAVLLLFAGSAPAAVLINVTQAGGNVTFSTTGSLDITGAIFDRDGPFNTGFISGGSNWYIASGSGGENTGSGDNVAFYNLTGADGAFGTSGSFMTPPDSTSGDNFLIWGQGGGAPLVGLEVGYVSGSAINSQMVFSGTVGSLRMTAGTYNYSIPKDTITLNIVPVPAAAWLFLSGLGALGWARRKATT